MQITREIVRTQFNLTALLSSLQALIKTPLQELIKQKVEEHEVYSKLPRKYR